MFFFFVLCFKITLLGRPRGIGRRGRWEGGLGWGIHVNPWLILVNVWQKPLQYCKVISLQLIKKKKKITLAAMWKITFNGTGGLIDIEKPIRTPLQCYQWETMVVRTRREVAEMGKNELNSIYSKVEFVEFDEESKITFRLLVCELNMCLCHSLGWKNPGTGLGLKRNVWEYTDIAVDVK